MYNFHRPTHEMTTDAPSTTQKLRLRGDIDGRDIYRWLSEGEAEVGSADGSAVRLPFAGVSRRHARITIEGAALTVEDLGSKNGTFINDRPIVRGQATVDDVLRFGPVRLAVERIDADDAELGVIVDTDAVSTAVDGAGEVTTLLAEGNDQARAWLRLVQAALQRLMRTPGGDLEGAVTLVRARLEVEGAAVVEWVGGTRPVALAAAGTMGQMPSASDLEAAADDDEDPELRWVVDDRAPMTCVLVFPDADDPLGLILWGEIPTGGVARPLLRVLIRVAHLVRPRPMQPLPTAAAADDDETLRFPSGYVRAESAPMHALYAQLRAACGSETPVLILGDNGRGQGVAGAHRAPIVGAASGPAGDHQPALPCPLSSSKPSCSVSAAAWPPASSHDPASSWKRKAAPCFSDEVGDMAPLLQAKLLRALQEKEIHPLGKAAIQVDVRIVAATNTDLRRRIEDGAFRRDLYYRLAGYELHVPALRQRPDDLPQLVAHFLRGFCRENGKTVRGITVKALRALSAYPWPGNVRELEHEARRMVDRCPNGQAIDSSMLSEEIINPRPGVEDLLVDLEATEPKLDAHLEIVERRLLHYALRKTRGNQTRAAKLLGISRNGLAKRLKRLEIAPGDPTL